MFEVRVWLENPEPPFYSAIKIHGVTDVHFRAEHAAREAMAATAGDGSEWGAWAARVRSGAPDRNEGPDYAPSPCWVDPEGRQWGLSALWEARQVACPKCWSQPGEPCDTGARPRDWISIHRDRSRQISPALSMVCHTCLQRSAWPCLDDEGRPRINHAGLTYHAQREADAASHMVMRTYYRREEGAESGAAHVVVIDRDGTVIFDRQHPWGDHGWGSAKLAREVEVELGLYPMDWEEALEPRVWEVPVEYGPTPHARTVAAYAGWSWRPPSERE